MDFGKWTWPKLGGLCNSCFLMTRRCIGCVCPVICSPKATNPNGLVKQMLVGGVVVLILFFIAPRNAPNMLICGVRWHLTS